ncbi:unnamed protein product [Calypogeia fissa]
MFYFPPEAMVYMGRIVLCGMFMMALPQSDIWWCWTACCPNPPTREDFERCTGKFRSLKMMEVVSGPNRQFRLALQTAPCSQEFGRLGHKNSSSNVPYDPENHHSFV